MSLYNDEGLDGWTTGGCNVLAQGLHDVYPTRTEVWYLLSEKDQVEHVVVKWTTTGAYMDAEGEYNEEQLLAEYPTAVKLSRTAPNGLGDIDSLAEDVEGVRRFIAAHLEAPFVVRSGGELAGLSLWTRTQDRYLEDGVAATNVPTEVVSLLQRAPYQWLVK